MILVSHVGNIDFGTPNEEDATVRLYDLMMAFCDHVCLISLFMFLAGTTATTRSRRILGILK